MCFPWVEAIFISVDSLITNIPGTPSDKITNWNSPVLVNNCSTGVADYWNSVYIITILVKISILWSGTALNPCHADFFFWENIKIDLHFLVIPQYWKDLVMTEGFEDCYLIAKTLQIHMVWQLSYLSNRNPNTWKMLLNLKSDAGKMICIPCETAVVCIIY